MTQTAGDIYQQFQSLNQNRDIKEPRDSSRNKHMYKIFNKNQSLDHPSMAIGHGDSGLYNQTIGGII
jgi:hypothetical protein